MGQVFFAVLKEKNLEQTAVAAVEAIHYRAGMNRYARLTTPAQRTDITRNLLVQAFLEYSKEPDDVLVMLDYDHDHPADIIDRLVAHNLPIVGALAFRRGEPYYPCCFFRGVDGMLRHARSWEPRLYRVDAMGTAAIAIRRSVFESLLDKGIGPPWFRYVYPEGMNSHPSEDMYFSACVEQAGIPMYCDFSLVTPHLTMAQIDAYSWHKWLAEHPDDFRELTIECAPPERILREESVTAEVGPQKF